MATFEIIIHPEPEGGYWAEVPELPGCYSEGETLDDVNENIRAAIAGALEVRHANGWWA